MPVGFLNRKETQPRQAEACPTAILPRCAMMSRPIFMRPIFRQTLLALLSLFAIAYVYDYLSVRHRMRAQKQGSPFDVVTYPHLLAIPQKGNKLEYALDAQSPMESESCVHSLFPHFGYTPCWYVRRKAKTPTQMTIVAPIFRLRFGRMP